MSAPLIIPTERENVILRQLSTEADDVAYFESYDFSRPEILVFDPDAIFKYRSAQDARDARLHKGDKIRMGIWDGNTFSGSVNVRPDEVGVEIGYWVDSRRTGNGYATLATRALSTYVLDRSPVVHANVKLGNYASARVLEKAGFKQIAINDHQIMFELPSAKEIK